MTSALEQMQAAGSTDEPIASVVLAAGRHAMYVELGAETVVPGDQRVSLGMLLLVVDVDGWATLHRVGGIYRRRGERSIRFGPRVPWPDGSVAARHIPEKYVLATGEVSQ